jgi:uncharacterized protein YycO
MKMETITIGFSKSKKKFAIISYLIRLYMQTPYSHVYIKFYSKSLDKILIYEAVGSGVRFIGSKMWDKYSKEIVSYKIQISQEEKIKLLSWCVDNAGCNYGFMQNLGILIAKIFKLKNNPFKKGKNCSELVGEFLSNIGYKFDKNLNLLTPKDIYLALNQLSSSPNSQCSRSDT